MKYSRKGTSIVEAIVVLVIVVTGVVGMYDIFHKSMVFSNTTANRIQATQIAREGIEAFSNIRNTNWILFGVDYANCWNTLNYNGTCVGNNGFGTDIVNGGHYIIYKNVDDRWFLEEKTGPFIYSDSGYRADFRVGLDSTGLYTQTGATQNIRPIFTRELIITYPTDTNGDTNTDSNDEKLRIRSVVSWIDSSSEKNHKIELETIISNWRNEI